MTKLYNSLSTQIGKETVEALSSYIEKKVKNQFVENSEILAIKEERLYDLLSVKIGKETTEILITYIEERINERRNCQR